MHILKHAVCNDSPLNTLKLQNFVFHINYITCIAVSRACTEMLLRALLYCMYTFMRDDCWAAILYGAMHNPYLIVYKYS